MTKNLRGISLMCLMVITTMVVGCGVVAWANEDNSIPQYSTIANDLNAYPIQVNGKYGFINQTGDIVVSPQYDDIRALFGIGYAIGLGDVCKATRTQQGCKRGIIDYKGKIVVSPRYDEIRHHSFGYAIVGNGNNCISGLGDKEYDCLWGIVDKNGKVVVNTQYRWIKSNEFTEMFLDYKSSLSTNVFVVANGSGCDNHSGSNNCKWGLLNRDGMILLETIYDRIYRFSEGVAWVVRGNEYSIIDKTGNCVHTGDNLLFADEFYEGLALVSMNGAERYYDKHGNIAIELNRGMRGNRFSEGLAPVHQSGKYGYIDKDGNVAIEMKFQYALPFSNGVAKVGIGKNTCGSYYDCKWGYINKSGEMVIQPKDDISDFHDGLAAFCTRANNGNCNWGFVDQVDNEIIKQTFMGVSGFKNGYSIIRIGEACKYNYESGYSSCKWGVIDMNGNYIVQPEYDYIDGYDKDYYIAGVGTTCGMEDFKYIVKKHCMYGIFDKQGKSVITPKYDKISIFNNDLAAVTIDDRTGYLNLNGTYVWAPTK